MATLLCVPIMVADLAPALAAAREARDLGADLVEYRIDHIFHGEGDADGEALAIKLAHESPLPCIITCRAASEGGDYDGDDAARIALYERLGTAEQTHPPRYIDVEFATYTRSPNLRLKVNLAVRTPGRSRELATGLILSTHDFNGRPANLFSTLGKMREEPVPHVLKLAWRARSLRDNLEVFDILLERDRPTIALAMGEFGLMSRVLAPKFGGFLTFASLRDLSATAPGQPTVRELLSLYRFHSITRSTRVYGVIGWPVGHSLSPAIHNAGFEWLEGRVGADTFSGVYLPMPIPPEWEHFKATLASLLDYTPLDFRGASVTLPHKEHLLRFAREDRRRVWRIDPEVQRAGAANTLAVQSDGSVRISNTDIPGVLHPLARALARAATDFAGLRVLIFGAGGAARAAAAGLLDAGAEVLLCNRTPERAARLADALAAPADRLRVLSPADVSAARVDVIVNCTPLGMKGGPDADASPISQQELEGFDPRPVVFDTVYNPLETPLLVAAKYAGCRVIPGLEMFVEQAASQFERWTDLSPGQAPRSLFHTVARETLDSALA